MTSKAFQDQIPNNHCFGCGPLNPHGLQIKSHWDGEEAVCWFQPSPAHAAGPVEWLNGGIIATIIDCHTICTATAWLYRQQDREIGTDPHIWCVTGAMSIKYLLPAPIEDLVTLRARIDTPGERKLGVACTMESSGKVRATALVTAILVDPNWGEKA